MRRAHQIEMIDAQVQRVLEEPEGWTNVAYSFPDFYFTAEERGGKRFCIHLELSAYDLEPPRAEIVHRFAHTRAPRAKWPRDSAFTERTNHPDTNAPWCCTVGVREYHDHYHHRHDTWDAHRNWMDLRAIVATLTHLLRQPARVMPR